MTLKPLFLVLILFCPGILGAQPDCDELNWPDGPADRKALESNLARFSDLFKAGKFEDAMAPHQWLLQNQPQFNKLIYINGAKMLSGLIESNDDPDRKMVYVDSLMLLYDMRAKNCQGEAEVISRKAYDSYRYTHRNTDRLPLNLEMFDQAFNLNGADIPTYMLVPYMNIIRHNYKIHKNLTEEEVTERYNRIIIVTDNRVADEGMDKIRETVDDMYLEIILGENPDCATIKEKLGPRFEEEPANEKTVRLLFSMLTRTKCTSDPLWLEVGEAYVKLDPKFGTYYTLSTVALSQGDLGRARILTNEALKHADNSNDKASAWLRLGAIESEQGNYSEARKYYREALEEVPGHKDAYTAIGNLYMRSFDRCKEEKNKVKDRLVFLAAYDQYVAGGNTEMAAQAKEQFPSKVEIFEQTYEVGQEMNTGCWMNETVVLRSRD